MKRSRRRKDERNRAILNLHLEGFDSSEIAEKIGMTRQGIDKVTQQIKTFEFVAELEETALEQAGFQEQDFQIPHIKRKTGGVKYFG
ncbi:MAG TPA: hypothetical protein EYQ50_21210 [Verrucomicrobiales bacterium]|nr:hypothetical protein [Verrucomicrobiales bacterium]